MKKRKKKDPLPPKNKLLIAAAGSGKTTFLITEALKIKDGNVLITTYTEDNEAEIRNKIIELNNFIPSNITVQTWFSFLLQHGVRPYQGCLFKPSVKGMVLINERSGIKYKNASGMPVPFDENTELDKFYFTPTRKIYSDKISKFVLRCNEASGNEVIARLNRIYTHIFIDEIQDMAGYDLDIVQLLFKSPISTILVGDPRQVTYLTHIEAKYGKYRNGFIKEFVLEKTPKKVGCIIDETSLGKSHRNNAEICVFASKVYPDFSASQPCICTQCRQGPTGHDGIFLVGKQQVEKYLSKYQPIQLRWDIDTKTNPNYKTYNFGKSKGLSFDRVLIYMTAGMANWLENPTVKLASGARAKLYVAITRARYSVALVSDSKSDFSSMGISRYSTEA